MNDPDKAVREPLATGCVACTDGAADFELDGFRVPVLASAAEEAEKSRLYARSNSSSTSWPLMMGASMLCRRTVRISCHADLTFVQFNLGCAKASSDYKWFTSDVSILSVSAYGIIQAKRPGIATVKVVSTFDSQNFDEVRLHLLIPQIEKIYLF